MVCRTPLEPFGVAVSEPRFGRGTGRKFVKCKYPETPRHISAFMRQKQRRAPGAYLRWDCLCTD